MTYLLYRGMIIGVRNLHLLLISINLNSTNLVGIKRKICIVVLQWGACSSETLLFVIGIRHCDHLLVFP